MNSTPKLELLESRPIEGVPDHYDGWDVSILQIDPGQACCFVRSVSFDDLVITWTSESHGSIANYAVQNDTTVFHFTHPRNRPTNWCGLELPHEMMLINPSGRDYVSAQRGRFDAMSIQISNDLLAKLDILPDTYLLAGEISTRWMITIDMEGKQFRSWLFNIFSDLDSLTTLVKEPAFETGLRDAVLQGIGDILDSALQLHHRQVQRQHRRLHLARQAQDLITDQIAEIHSAEHLATELNMSPRTLRKLFQDVFQTSPYQYLLSYRLQCTRLELLRRRGNAATISHIATQYGFEELGRFSQYYQRMYGELPSATLKKL